MLDEEKRGRPILEVIVCSVEDALEAERGGADRLEVVRDLASGGLTPDLNLVRGIRRAVSLPLRVMLRDRDGYSYPGDDALSHLRAVAFELQQIGVDGLVTGFLRNGNADMERTLALLNAAPRLGTTFHHAFDETEDPLRAINELKKSFRIDRILSSGGPGTISERALRLDLYQKEALDEIVILAGGNLDEEAIRVLRVRTSIREFHVGRAARSPRDNSGAVRAELVERLRRILSNDDHCVTAKSSTATGCSNE